MENERFGVVRDSMDHNQLLQKAELGKIKRRCYTLPGTEFTYGQNSFMKEGGVAAAIGHWNSVEANKSRHKKPQSNFVALNREAVKSGLVTAAEHQAYRNTHDIWRPSDRVKIDHAKMVFPPDTTFGICTRPSTAIYDLLENKYQYLWIEQQRQASEELRLKSKEKMRRARMQDTRTTLLRRYQPPTDPAPLWQLPRFQKIGPHLNTFPNEEARRKAFSAHHSDGIARRGLHAQGIYTIN
ncbi:cilia- and flagella-associated protein 77 [Pelodytes ibericus]